VKHPADMTRQELEDEVSFLRDERGLLATASYRPLITGKRTVEMVAEKHGLTMIEIKSRDRSKRIVRPRQEAIYRVRQLGWSYPRIGRFFGLDHSTCIHSVRVHAERMAG
jgi:chromosomal replication initiation ATPase DnaA